jgi:hypothetical protein
VIGKLPGWVVDDATSVRREVQEWVGTTPAERWRLAVLCSRDAMWAIQASRDPQRLLDWEDPLPESSVAALSRLRAAARGRDGR